MKERPIIFNAEMVNAILSGRKTQTRRPVKNQRVGDMWSVKPAENPSFERHSHDWWLPTGTKPYSALACPFGKIGDRLYVRESFSKLEEFEFFDPKVPQIVPDFWYWADGEPTWGDWTRPASGALMPKAASRITLEITGVRVERLQDISQKDAIAEGGPPSHPSIDAVSRDYGFPDFSRSWFGQTWDHIYGAESWQDNSWVWVIEFKRVENKS